MINKQELKEDDKLTKIINHRQMAERMYLNLVQKFIDEQCEFDQNAIVSFTDLKSYWDQWIRDNDHDIKKYNVSWRVKLKDISRLDNRFEVKRIANCKFCKKRHFARCCNQYVYKGCTTEHAMQNIKLKSISDSIENNIQDESTAGTNLL